MEKSIMGKIYLYLIVLLPVLSIYVSPLPGVDLGTFLILLFFCVIVATGNFYRLKKMTALYAVLFYTLMVTIINITLSNQFYSSQFSILARTFRFEFLLISTICIFYDLFFNVDSFVKILRNVTLFVSTYAVMQKLWYSVTGLKLINVIGGTKQGIVFDSALATYEFYYRPPSIFLEPSSVTYFVIPYLCMCLFLYYAKKSNIVKYPFVDAVVISVGLICTTSGQGLFVLAFIWGVWLIREWIYIRRVDYHMCIILLVFISMVVLEYDMLAYSVGRIFSDSGMNAVDARSGGYLAFENLETINKIFGVGFGNYIEDFYYSSLADILFCTGYIGLFLVLVFYLDLFFKGVLYQKILILAIILLMTGGGVYTATYLCFYIPMLISDDEYH